MPVRVNFMRGGFVLSNSILGVAEVVAAETITIPGTTVRPVASGEWVLITSTEANVCNGAWGSTPDAAANAATAATSAGFAIAPNQPYPASPTPGALFNFKVFS